MRKPKMNRDEANLANTFFQPDGEEFLVQLDEYLDAPAGTVIPGHLVITNAQQTAVVSYTNGSLQRQAHGMLFVPATQTIQ